MKLQGCALVSAVLLGVISPANAQTRSAAIEALDAALPGNLINDPSRLDWNIFGPGVQNKNVRGNDIPGGGAAVQFTIPKAGATPYEIGANVPITAPVKSGQQLVIGFYARTLKAETPSGKGRLGVRFQRNSAPYPGFGDATLTIGTDWQFYEVRGRANVDFPLGLGVVNFQLSGAKQVLEIGQTIIVEGVSTIRGEQAPVAAAPVMLPQLEGKGAMINEPGKFAWEYYGAMTHTPIAVKTIPGGAGVSFVVPAAGKNVYDAGANIPVNAPIQEGDVLNIAVLARTVSADTANGAAKIGLRIQRNAAPYDGFGDNSLTIGPKWGLYQLRTQARLSFAAGQARVALHLAGAKQSVEVGPVFVQNGGPPKPAQ